MSPVSEVDPNERRQSRASQSSQSPAPLFGERAVLPCLELYSRRVPAVSGPDLHDVEVSGDRISSTQLPDKKFHSESYGGCPRPFSLIPRVGCRPSRPSESESWRRHC